MVKCKIYPEPLQVLKNHLHILATHAASHWLPTTKGSCMFYCKQQPAIWFTSTRHANGLLGHEIITSNRFFNLLNCNSRSTETRENGILKKRFICCITCCLTHSSGVKGINFFRTGSKMNFFCPSVWKLNA